MTTSRHRTLPGALLLSAAITLTLAACSRAPAPPSDDRPIPATDAAQAVPALDTSKLPPVNRFQVSDIDSTIAACTDFDAHVNGKWRAANPIPPDRSSWGAFEILDERSQATLRQLAERAAADSDASGVEKIIGDLYATGMDQAKIDAQGLTPLRSRLDAIDAITDQATLVAHLRNVHADGEQGLFGFGPAPDFKNASVNLAYAAQGGLGLPDRGYYFDQDKRDKLTAYQDHIAKILALAGTDRNQAEAQAKAIIGFETRLAKASKSSQELARDSALYYNPVSLAQADALTPNFSWSEFFQRLGVAAPETFSLAMPAFHQEASAMMADTPIDTWKAYLRFHLLDRMSPYLSNAFVQQHFHFHAKTMGGQQQLQERWKQVLDAIESEAGEAFGQIYVKTAFSAESKARMQTLVDNLGQALKARLEALPWMSADTKRKALEKWRTFTPKIGYPDKWRDWSGLRTSRDSYLGNVLAANTFNHQWQMAKIGKPVDKSEWHMSPQTVNAYYNPQQNEIVFPAAILQPPFFDPEADDAYNYGGIGAVIGHEMIHGYDDQGARFGPSGNFENWWAQADSKRFKTLTDALIRQFGAYEALPGQHVDGKLTLGENIADLGGLAVAYDAMRKAVADAGQDSSGLSRDQRFFANFATIWRRNMALEQQKLRLTTDPHAPGRFRVIGPLSNMDAFATAFGCKPGDAMVRDSDKRIQIW